MAGSFPFFPLSGKAAWAALADNAAVINQEIPARLPESARPALRDYLFARYNQTFPALQQEMMDRVAELSTDEAK